jgi:hypothetical protein
MTSYQSVSHYSLKFAPPLLYLYIFLLNCCRCRIWRHNQVLLRLSYQKTLKLVVQSFLLHKIAVFYEYDFQLVLNVKYTQNQIYRHRNCSCCHLTLLFRKYYNMKLYQLWDYASLVHSEKGILNSIFKYNDLCNVKSNKNFRFQVAAKLSFLFTLLT